LAAQSSPRAVLDALRQLPTGAWTSAGGYLYGTSGDRDGIRRYDKTSGAAIDVAGNTGATGYADSTGTDALFSEIYGLASDGTNLWATDGNRLRVVQAVKAPLAAGGPTRPGETWGCGPSSESATAPACTDFVDPATGATTVPLSVPPAHCNGRVVGGSWACLLILISMAALWRLNPEIFVARARPTGSRSRHRASRAPRAVR